MKTNKQFTIDIEIAEKLKNTNASQLVNTLLKEYFDLRQGKNTLKDEKKAVFDAISKKKSNFLKKLRLLMSGTPLVWTIFRKIGLRLGWTSLRGLISIPMWRIEDSERFLEILKEDINYFESTGNYYQNESRN